MKATEPVDAIARAMQPGTISCEGFLGNDSRPLAEILAADLDEVQRLGLSHRQIALRMKEFRDAGEKGFGEWIAMPPHWEVRTDAVRGQLPCPFEDRGLYKKTMITVRNMRNKSEIVYSDLLIHLIEQHGFYEGIGSVFRLEPHQIAETLELG